MKKLIPLLMILVSIFALSACTVHQDGPAAPNGMDATQTTADENQEKYNNIIQYLQSGEYDIAIDVIKQMEQEAIKAENAGKGIQEITITSENWQDYFTLGDDVNYYLNSFGEITHINGSTGFCLKEGYELVLDDPNCQTSVAFEVEQQPYVADVTYDFTAGTFALGEEKAPSNGKNSIHTNTYSTSVYHDSKEYPATGVCGIGYQWQGDIDDGTVQEEIVYRIVQVMRAEGTLYIYEK